MKKSVVTAVTCLTWAGMLSVASAADADTLARGKALFTGKAVPACAVCHTLADAGAEGSIGPDLDELKPEKSRILKALKEGMGAMPSFAASLSDEDRDAVADYVVSATGG